MEYNNDMDQANNKPAELSADQQGRRELVTKLGKFAVYAAPFTVMALNSKAKRQWSWSPRKESRWKHVSQLN